MTVCLAGLTQRTLGDVLALLGGKQAHSLLGETLPLICCQGVPRSGRLNVEPSVFNGELDSSLV